MVKTCPHGIPGTCVAELSPTGRKPSPPALQNVPVRTELGRAIRASFSSTQPNLWPQSVSRDLAAEMVFQTLARDPDPMLRAAVTGSLDPYIPGKHPTTHCFFCVTCNMLVPNERHEEHAGHEIER